jgi:DNA-binding IclR family transcriptional regulator
MTPPRVAEPPVNQSVERAARMLGLFSAEEPELTLAQVTERMGLTKATAHRYATALRRAGLLRFAGGAYTLGPRVVELASAALAGLGVVKLAGPYLERLVDETSQTAVLSVWDGEAPVVVRVADNTDRLVRIVVVTGSRLPRDSAQAKVFRACMGENGDAELAAVRETGLAFYAHVIEGIAALAAPVFQGEDIVATLALVGTTVSIEQGGDRLGRALAAAADALSTELGFVQAQRRDAS